MCPDTKACCCACTAVHPNTPAACRSRDAEQLHTLVLEGHLGAGHPYIPTAGIHVCRVAVQPDTRPDVAAGCPYTLLPAGERGRGRQAPRPRRGRAAARRPSGAAIIPTPGRTRGREGKGLALRPMTLKDTPSGSHCPPHGRAAGPARQLPWRAGRHFQSGKGKGGSGGARGEGAYAAGQGEARGGVGSVSSFPRRPSPARLNPPQGSPEGQAAAGREARQGAGSRQAPPQQHSRRHLAPAATSLQGRGKAGGAAAPPPDARGARGGTQPQRRMRREPRPSTRSGFGVKQPRFGVSPEKPA